MSLNKITVESGQEGKRLDIFLAENFSLSRSYLQSLIKDGKILVNQRKTKSSYKVAVGDILEVFVPSPEPLSLEREDIPLEVIYEDVDLIAINKPAGMTVHPCTGVYEGTLVNALLFQCLDLSGINGVLRPGIVHRLDKDTTGIMLVAKNDKTHQNLAKQWQEGLVDKRYLALVNGSIPLETAEIQAPIGRHPTLRKKMSVTSTGKKSATSFTALQRWNDYTFLILKLITGRTHQIRVHLSEFGYPVVGDEVYGRKDKELGFKRQALHAYSISFLLNDERITLKAPLPVDFQEALTKLSFNFDLLEDKE